MSKQLYRNNIHKSWLVTGIITLYGEINTVSCGAFMTYACTLCLVPYETPASWDTCCIWHEVHLTWSPSDRLVSGPDSNLASHTNAAVLKKRLCSAMCFWLFRVFFVCVSSTMLWHEMIIMLIKAKAGNTRKGKSTGKNKGRALVRDFRWHYVLVLISI